MSKENKLQKAIKLEDKKSKKNKAGRNIMGVLQLFVVASIAYSTTVIAMGTEGYLPVALTVPQAVYAVIVLIKRFSN